MDKNVRKNIIVITGGPGFGKTSIINELHNQGYRVGKEAARDLILNYKVKRKGILPMENPDSFQRNIFAYRKSFWNSIPGTELAFSDRAIPDQLAYMEYRNVKELAELNFFCRTNRYFPIVFITPPWKEIFVTDEIRKETWKEACLIHNLILTKYQQLNYYLYSLPFDTVEKRCQQILRIVKCFISVEK